MNVKEKISSIFLAGVAVLSLTGCMNIDVKLTLDPNGTDANLDYSIAFAKENFENELADYGSEVDESICATVQELTMDQEGETSKFTWSETGAHCVATMSMPITYGENGIESSLANEDFGGKAPIEITRVGDKAHVLLDTYGFSNEIETIYIDDIKIAIEFPVKVTDYSHGGKISEDEKSVTWDLKAVDSDGYVSAVGVVDEPAIWGFVTAGAVIFIAISTLAAIVVTKRLSKKEPSKASEA